MKEVTIDDVKVATVEQLDYLLALDDDRLLEEAIKIPDIYLSLVAHLPHTPTINFAVCISVLRACLSAYRTRLQRYSHLCGTYVLPPEWEEGKAFEDTTLMSFVNSRLGVLGWLPKGDLSNLKVTNGNLMCSFKGDGYSCRGKFPKVLNEVKGREVYKFFAEDIITNCTRRTTAVTFRIDVRPIDILLASENTTGWRSCFSKNGCHHNSCMLYASSPSLLVCHAFDAKGRQMFRSFFFAEINGRTKKPDYVFRMKHYGDISPRILNRILGMISCRFFGEEVRVNTMSSLQYHARNRGSNGHRLWKDHVQAVAIPLDKEVPKTISASYTMTPLLTDMLNFKQCDVLTACPATLINQWHAKECDYANV